MLLMFGVGLHFSLDDLLAVKRIALPGAVVQMAMATVLGMGMAWWWGWEWGAALILGLSLSCASTVVLLKALEARGMLDTMNGRIAVGWLVVEDLATVMVLVLLPPLAGALGGIPMAAAGAAPVWRTIGQTLLEVSAFIALMLIVGRRALPWMLWQVTRTGSRELFTLAVIASAICIAFAAAQLFSVSFALGAFFAGMVMRGQSLRFRRGRAARQLGAGAFGTGAPIGKPRGPVRRAADDDRAQVSPRAGGAGRLRAGRAAHRPGPGRPRHPLCRRRAKPHRSIEREAEESSWAASPGMS